MTRREIVKEVAEAHDLTLAKSERIVATVLDTIVEGVSDGKSVKLSKFGAFEKSTSAARIARNPKTGESVKVPTKQRIRFRPSKHFKDTVQ
jgi:nucleoid DNA-binding protein